MLSRELATGLAKTVEQNIPNGYGFCLLLFPFGKGEGNRMQYISNANREDIVQAMKEWIKKTEADNFGKDL